MIASDLKHTLENVNCGNDFVFPIEKRIKATTHLGFEVELVRIAKESKSWKITDETGKKYTLSNQSQELQFYIHRTIMSEFDTRVKNPTYTTQYIR